MTNNLIIKKAQVESIVDDADGLRIKARTWQDGVKSIDDIPYAFPLLPKTIQTVPKVGECVLILTSKLESNDGNRYYIGPIISQPQFQYYDQYDYGRGSASSLLQDGYVEPLEKISNYDSTTGAFPDINDVAIVGRKSEDLILKDNEIDIRCGIRGKAFGDDRLLGEVVFNKQSPAYIQLKYKNGIGYSKGQEANSVINLVADKVNIISHKDTNSFELTDNKELIKSTDMDSIMSKLHQLPYGDVLVDALTKIVNALVNHVHPYPGLPPCKDQYVTTVLGTDLKSILSDNVRIS